MSAWIKKPDAMFKDQRAFERRDATWGLTYATADGQRGQGFTRNVSGGGVRFVAQHALEQGAILEVTLSLPGRPQPLVAMGEVAWSKWVSSPDAASVRGASEVGVRFTQIVPKDQELVLRYLGVRL